MKIEPETNNQIQELEDNVSTNPLAQQNDAQKPPFSFKEIMEAFERNEDGDAYLMSQLFKDLYIYDHASQRWHIFVGPTWVKDRIEEVLASTEALADVYRYAAKQIAWNEKKAKKAGKKEAAAAYKAMRKEVQKRICELHALPRKKRILELAVSGQNSLGISGDEWDRDPYVLAFENGVLDLKTFEFREGLPSDYLKRKANAAWKSIDEPAPIWEETLRTTFNGNQELVDFFQRVVGISLLGIIRKHFIIILWGKGRNGKTKLLEAINYTFGDYAGPIQSETLVKQNNSRLGSAPAPDILGLRGKRIVWASETDDGQGLNVGKIKNLTGGDTIVARGMYAKNEVTFEPSHSLFLLTNYLPIVPATDFALWERIFLIPFTLAFIENPTKENERKEDTELDEKLRTEAFGIAAWAVRGYVEYTKMGLAPPKEVKIASADYQRKQDFFQDFLEAETIIDADGKVQSGDLWNRYGEWCRKEGYTRSTRKIFSDDLLDRGFPKEDGRNVFYLGIQLKKN